MTDHTIWLDSRIVRAIHDEQLAEHGGAPGLRDAGLLESALARPQQYGQSTKAGIPELAAITAIAIARNHPFTFGNKRSAFVALELFLELNGYELKASDAESVVVMLALAAGDMEDAEFIDWVAMSSFPKP
jgi:death-on-curing protein